ncbi:MAG: hypothetical protein Kow0042_23610 [Calditrichia bacterium]
MNKLKSVFITLYTMWAAVGGVYSLFRFYGAGFKLSWLGPVMALLLPAGFLGYLMLFRPGGRTRPNLPVVSSLIILGGLVSLWSFIREDSVSLFPALLVLGGLAGWGLYLFWYSRLPQRTAETITVGSKLPDFELADLRGETVASSRLLDRPAVFLFYRGNWCPLCMAQIREIAAQYRELDRRGVVVNLVSPQPVEQSRKLAERYQVNFRFLVDQDNRAARRLGLLHRNGVPAGMELLGYQSDTTLPAVIITDKQGTVIWYAVSDNYRVRPEPQTFLRVLDENLAGPEQDG